MGSVVSQVEAPFSWESSTERRSEVKRLFCRSLAFSSCFQFLVCLRSLLMCCCNEWQSPSWCSWLIIHSTSGPLICCEEFRCSLAESTGFVRPRPPSHAGRANNSRICSPGGGCPVSAGIKCECIACSKGFSTSAAWCSSQSVTLRR